MLTPQQRACAVNEVRRECLAACGGDLAAAEEAANYIIHTSDEAALQNFLDGAWTDEFGITYSADGVALSLGDNERRRTPFVDEYGVNHTVEVVLSNDEQRQLNRSRQLALLATLDKGLRALRAEVRPVLQAEPIRAALAMFHGE